MNGVQITLEEVEEERLEIKLVEYMNKHIYKDSDIRDKEILEFLTEQNSCLANEHLKQNLEKIIKATIALKVRHLVETGQYNIK